MIIIQRSLRIIILNQINKLKLYLKHTCVFILYQYCNPNTKFSPDIWCMCKCDLSDQHVCIFWTKKVGPQRVLKAVTTIEASEAIASLKCPSIFFNKWFTKVSYVLCILVCWIFPSSIKLFQWYNSQPIPYVIIYRSSLSVKPYVGPSFSYIMSFKDWSQFLFGSWRNNLNQVVHNWWPA
jgi:hypothetical protein